MERKYVVDLIKEIQYNKADNSNQRPIRREIKE